MAKRSSSSASASSASSVSSSTSATTKRPTAAADVSVAPPVKRTRSNLRSRIPLLPLLKRPTVVGNVFSCGHGDFGQLGLGNGKTERTRPEEIKDLHDANIVAVVAGGMHTVALDAAGKVFTWGVNDDFALGRNTSSRTADTVGDDVGELESAPASFVKLAAGDSFSAALDEVGNVWGWGQFRNSNGAWKLDASTSRSLVPIRIPVQRNVPIVDICAGSDHLVLLGADGQIQTVGANEMGQLGRTLHATRRTSAEDICLHAKYVDDAFEGDVRGISVHAGSYHTLVRCNDGSLYTFGLNRTGQLGWGSINQHEFNPELGRAEIPGTVVDADGGEHHSIACNELGHVYAWGRNDGFQLGLGHDKDERRPQRVTALDGIHVVAVRASGHMSAAISKEGKIYVWGDGQCGQLAMGNITEALDQDDETVRKPTLVDLKSRKVLDWAFGGQHSVLLLTPKVASD